MNYCGYCGRPGHNRRTCPQRKENLTKAAEAGNVYAKAELERKASPRTCGFCNLRGHDRRTCEHLKSSVKELGNINLQVRKEMHKRAKAQNFGVGSLVSIVTSNYVDGRYMKLEQFGIVQEIAWDRVGLFNEWEQSSNYADPIVVQFFNFTGLQDQPHTRRYAFPFEIGYLGLEQREFFPHWRFDGDIKIVNAVRGDKEGESSLLDVAGCQELAKKILKDREWGHGYASRRIHNGNKMIENFTSREG